MMRTLRQHIGWLFFVLVVVPFMGWMVFDVGMGITGRSAPSSNLAVFEINGTDVQVQEWEAAKRDAYEALRQREGRTPTNREERDDFEDQLKDQMIQQVLLQQEERRLKIGVTDEEIIQAVRQAPPPQITGNPDFQTNGQFDQRKWDAFLASGAAREVLFALESSYRRQIPESKLVQMLVSDVYVSDAKLWRMYRDARDTVWVRLASVTPEQASDQAVSVAESDLQAYYDAHRDDYKRPATAYVSFVAVDRRPNAQDTAAALATARRVRAEAARGGVTGFAEVAKRESRDSASAVRGGELGWVRRGQMVDQFEAAVFRLGAGQVSQPVATPYGYHIIMVERVTRDSVKARHILIPVELQGEHLDHVDTRVDSLDRYAADQTSGAPLDTLAARMAMPLGKATVRQGEPLMLGRYRIPDVHLWAFEAAPGATSPVIEAQPAFYVFRLDSLHPEGVASLEEVRATVSTAVHREKRMAEARRIADRVAAELTRTRSLTQAAPAAGLLVQTLPPFTRLNPSPRVSAEPALLGAAFGLRVGETSGLIAGEHGFYFLESLARKGADSTAWRAQLQQQREQVLRQARQARVQLYYTALRERARIADNRSRIYRQQPLEQNSPGS